MLGNQMDPGFNLDFIIYSVKYLGHNIYFLSFIVLTVRQGNTIQYTRLLKG